MRGLVWRGRSRAASDGLLTRILDWWGGRPVIDLVMALLLVSLHLFAFFCLGFIPMLPWADSDQRLDVYSAGASMTSMIAGFAAAAIAVYASSSGRVAVRMRSDYGKVLRKNWTSILTWLLVSALLCIFAMTIESEDSANYSQWVFELAVSLAIVKFARLIFLFGLIMKASDADVVKVEDSAPRWNPSSVSAKKDQFQSGI